ncbi:hypothetical protein C8R43DRAFT_185332 [Mycena crocata]|nr:hypothetical protein C8R43DRAFT_185332 [Mycena crocata]
MDSDSSAAPLLCLACRFLPHDQWFTTHVDPDWKVRQVKSWLLAKCLPYAAPPSPPLRQSTRKPQRPPSPITFAPDPRHRPISPITFAMPKQTPVPDDASSDEEPPADDELSEPEAVEIRPPPQPKKRALPPSVETSAKGDLYSQFTLIRFSTGQLLEDDLPLSFYDMQADELLELHRLGVVVTLPRADPTRYLDAYWEGWVRVLRMRPLEEEEDSYTLYKIRPTETRTLEWRDRWLVVREGSIYLCRDESRLIHTLSLADLVALNNSSSLLPSSATPSSSTRILLARFSAHPRSHAPTRASSPLTNFGSDSSSALSSPVFAHESSDSNRPRRIKTKKRKRKKPDPEFLALDLKDDSAYVSLLRVLHRHALPASTFVDSLPVGPGDKVQPRSARPEGEEDDAEDEAPPPLRHPPSLAHLRVARGGLSLGALPFPEWRTNLLARARRAGMGRIGKAVEWVLWNGDCGDDPHGWTADGPISRKGKGRERLLRIAQPRSTDGYDSDVSGDASFSDGDVEEEEEEEEEEDSDDEGYGGRTGGRSETEWVGWMGDLRRQARVTQENRERARAREEARRIAEEARDAELGLPPLLALSGAEIVTVTRVGTGVDDRTRRAALEPTAVVTSLSGVNPPQHNPSVHSHSYSSTYAHTNASGSGSVSTHPTPILSSPSSAESLAAFAFSPLAPPTELDEDVAYAHSAYSHTRAHSHTHTLLHSVSMHDVQPHHAFAPSTSVVPLDGFARRPSMPVIGSASRWGEGSRPSSVEREHAPPPPMQSTSTVIMEVPRTAVVRTGSVSGKGLLRKKDNRERERESESDRRREKDARDKDKDKDRAGRPRLSLSTSARNIHQHQPPMSPPATPHEGDYVGPLGGMYTDGAPGLAPPAKKKRRGLARGVSIRAEKLVKSLDSALDFVDGR